MEEVTKEEEVVETPEVPEEVKPEAETPEVAPEEKTVE